MISFCKELFSPSDAYSAEKTLLWVTFLLGLTPFRLCGPPGQRKLRISRLGFLNTILQLCFFMFCFIYSLVVEESIVGLFFQSEISKVGDMLQKFIGMTGMLILFGISLRKYRDIIFLCQSIHELDQRFLTIGVVFKYRYIMKFTHSKLFLVIGVNCVYMSSSLWLLFRNDIWPSYQAIVSFFLPHVFLLMVVVLFSALGMRLQQHFDLINKYFRGFVDDVRNPKDLQASLRFIFLLALIFGLIPFQVCSTREGSPQRLRSTFLGYLNVGLRVLFYSISFVYSMVKDQSLLAYFFHSSISLLTDSMQKFNGMFGIVLELLICLFERRHFLRFLLKFELIEWKFFGVGVAFLHKVSARRMNRNMALMVFSTVGYIAFSNLLILKRNSIYASFSACIAFYSPQILVCGMVVMFMTTTFKLREYLRALNKVLKNLLHQWDKRSIGNIAQKQRSFQCLDSFSIYTVVTKNPSEIVQESMDIHQLICEAASTANKYFTYQLLTIISIAFLIIVFDAYYVLETLLGKSQRESKFKTVEFVTFFSCQMILYLIAIISIVEGSNRAISKSEKTGSIVHSLLNKAKNPEVKEKLQQFSLQLLHSKINFTAAGLFNIDRTLYFTISGALTTYLIILLQFTSSAPEKEAPGICTVNNITDTIYS